MISVLIISKNDEDVISGAIKSVKDLADEIIVIDGGSEDKTIEVAEKLGTKVVKNKFKNFADQRNLAATFAHGDWIFYLDSDERATPEFTAELKRRIGEIKEIGGFWIKRKTFYYGKDWGFCDRTERIFQKDKLKGWHGIVHETPDVAGSLETINEPILHYTHRELSDMVEKTNEWSEYEAELRFHSNHPRMTLWRFPRVMITAFVSSYFGQNGWKNGTAGMIEAIYQAFSIFITYAKLWEKQRGKN